MVCLDRADDEFRFGREERLPSRTIIRHDPRQHFRIGRVDNDDTLRDRIAHRLSFEPGHILSAESKVQFDIRRGGGGAFANLG